MAEQSPGEDYAPLIKQIRLEYALCWGNQQNRIMVGLERLQLYNNQKRDKKLVGDPLLFSVHQTVLASLYDDRLMAEFAGREDGDNETGDNLTALAEYDYTAMKKDIHDYYWDWDALFYGRGITKLYEFNRDKQFMCPIPELFDPMTFLHDPDAISIFGDQVGRGAMRFGGREVAIERRKITRANGYLVEGSEVKSGDEVKSLIKQANAARNKAAGLDDNIKYAEQDLGDNEKINALDWYTYWKGERVNVTLSDNKSKVIKINRTGKSFGLIDRPMYPNSHSWDGVSIPDIVEDKQRHRSVILNLVLQGVKADLYPSYLYDESRIKNKADLIAIRQQKYVGVDGGGDVRTAVAPMNKASVSYQLANWILNTLDASIQRATATPDMQQGQISNEKRTASELNLVASRVDTRYSLSAKVFGWSERAFWEQWYRLYKDHFQSGIDKKVIRIAGSMGNKFRTLTKENIDLSVDPDVIVESKTVAENKRLKERQSLNGYAAVVAASPNAIGKRYFERKLARVNGMEPDEVNIIYPPTVDELVAQDENDKFLNKNKLTMVAPDDDDYAHIQIHNKASETGAKAAHIHAHKTQLILKRRQPKLFNQQAPTDQTTTAVDQSNKTPPSAQMPGMGSPGMPMTPSAAAAVTTAQ